MRKTIYTTALAILVSCGSLLAQEKETEAIVETKHEVSAWLGGGLSSLKYNPKIGSQSNGMGGVFGFGYSHFFTKNWALGTGLEFSFYNAKSKLDGISGNYNTKDFEGNAFNFRYKVDKYEDKQSAMFISIPIMAQYHFDLAENKKFFAALGTKIAIPTNEKSKIGKYNLTTSGYYAEEDYEYTDEPYMGFGKFNGSGEKENISLKTSVSLSAELGMKWNLGDRKDLYTGVYLDYGLNDINNSKRKEKELIGYNAENPTAFQTHSIMNNNYDNNGTQEAIVKKVNQMAVGLKVRFAFDVTGKPKAKELRTVDDIAPISPEDMELTTKVDSMASKHPTSVRDIIMAMGEVEEEKEKIKYEQEQHEYSAYIGGGLSTLNYSTRIGEQKNGFGGMLGGEYKYFFNDNMGIGAGLEFALYNSKMSFKEHDYRYMTEDYDGSDFEFRSNVKNHKEKQNMYALNIPIMFQYQTNGFHRFYAAGGTKISIPLSGKAKISDASYTNSGYYEYEDVEFTDQEFMGFGEFNDRNRSESLKLKTSFMLSVEAGMKWKLNENMYLYTGAYLDYGLTEAVKTKDMKLVEYNTPDPRNFIPHSVLMSEMKGDGTGDSFTKKVSPMAAGIKVKIAFGQKSKKQLETASLLDTQLLDLEAEARRLNELKDKEEAEKRAQREAERKEAAEAREEARKEAEAKRLEKEEILQKVEDGKSLTDEELKLVGTVAVVRAQEKRFEKIAVERRETAKKLILAPISEYALNQIQLTAIQKAELDAKIESMRDYPDIKIVAEGHTCMLGNHAVNERISKQRAQIVRRYLISKGIAAERITATAKGKTNPVVTEHGESDRRQNRRVELLVID